MLSALLHVLPPSSCNHCQEVLVDQGKLLCPRCLDETLWIDPTKRCKRCFSPQEKSVSSCENCYRSHLIRRRSAVFEYEGAAASLVKKLKYGGQQDLAKMMAACMVVQLEKTELPWPDWIVPVPQSKLRYLVRRYSQSALIACEMASIMGVPFKSPLSRSSWYLPQTAKNWEDRHAAEEESTQLKSSYDLADKTILLVDDVMTTGTTLEVCAKALAPGMPKAIYSMTFCLVSN